MAVDALPLDWTSHAAQAHGPGGLFTRAPETLDARELVQYTHLMFRRIGYRDNDVRESRARFVDLFNNRFYTRKVYNFVKPVVLKWATLLFGRPLKHNLIFDAEQPAVEAADPEDEAQQTGEEGEAYLARMARANSGGSELDRQSLEDFAQSVLNANLAAEKAHVKNWQGGIDLSLTGLGGAKIYWDDDLVRNCWTKMNPLNAYPEYQRNDSDTPSRVLYVYTMDLFAARKKYGKPDLQPAALPWEMMGITPDAMDRPWENWSQSVVVIDVEDYEAKSKGGRGKYWTIAGDTIVVPVQDIETRSFFITRNGYMPNSNSAFGDSDVKELCPINIDICTALDIMDRAMRNNAYPMFKTYGPIDLINWVPSPDSVVPTGEKKGEGDIEPILTGVNPFPMRELLNQMITMMREITMVPDAAFGILPSGTSGMAQNAAMAPMITLGETKKLNHDHPQRMIAITMLRNFALYGGKPFEALKRLFVDNDPLKAPRFDVQLRWPNQLPVDDVQYINSQLAKYDKGVQSYVTTMENLGIENPTEEMRRRASELTNPLLNPSLFRQMVSTFIQSVATKQQADIQTKALEARAGIPAPPGGPVPPGAQAPAPEAGEGTMDGDVAQASLELRQLLSGAEPELDTDGDPTVHIRVLTAGLAQAQEPEDRRAIQRQINRYQELLKGAGPDVTEGAPGVTASTPPGVPNPAAPSDAPA